MKKLPLMLGSAILSIALLAVGFAAPTAQALDPDWNVTGNYVINMEYQGTIYPHSMTLTQNSSGSLTGSGFYPTSGAHLYEWAVTSGSVSGSAINFTAHYTFGADAVNPQTILNASGTISGNGSISGTWTDNYQGGSRSGTFNTSGDAAVALRAINVTIAGSGSGSVSSNPTGINCSEGSCQSLWDNNTNVTLTATASAGSTFSGWSGACSGTGTCTINTSTNSSVTATFTENAPVTHTITASAGSGGSINPSGTVTVNHNEDKTFTITANSGFHVEKVLVDGVSVGAVSSYTFSNITGNHTISAAFAAHPADDDDDEDRPNKDDCKRGGWMTFTNPTFKNQGACVSFMNHTKVNAETKARAEFNAENQNNRDDREDNNDENKDRDNKNSNSIQANIKADIKAGAKIHNKVFGF